MWQIYFITLTLKRKKLQNIEALKLVKMHKKQPKTRKAVLSRRKCE